MRSYRKEVVNIKKVKSENSTKSTRKLRPALTPESRENQMISLAMDLVEQRLLDGTASSQETTHFLKIASMKSRLEERILESQNELLKAKTKSIESTQNMEKIYENALNAMREYKGSDIVEDDVDEN